MAIGVTLKSHGTRTLLNGKFMNAGTLTISGLVTSATATGLTITTTVVSGAITAGVIDAAGTGYSTGQIVGVAGGTGGFFVVTAQTGGVPSAIALYAGGSGYTTATGAATVSSNSVPHGLPTTPQIVNLVAGVGGLWTQAAPADATNLYINVASGGSASGWANVEYGRT
jgi:hypothetical protein